MVRRSGANRPPKPGQVIGEVATLLPRWKKHVDKAKMIDKVSKGRGQKPVLPRDTLSAEYDSLRNMSASPWGDLIVANFVQSLFVEGFRAGKGSKDNSPLWDLLWQPNGMDSRQSMLYSGALRHGQSYNRSLRAKDPLTGETRVQWRGESAMKTAAFYDDDETADYPTAVLSGDPSVDNKGRDGFDLRYYDDFHWHSLWAPAEMDEQNPTGIIYRDSFYHGTGVPPYTRYANNLDLDGNVTGEIEPLIPLFSRIDQDTFDRLIVQRFGAWVIRWATGLQKPQNPQEQAEQELALRISDLLINSSPEGKFGTLAGTPLEGFISAREHDIRDLAALSQTAPHYLTGSMINLSAEALAAAEAMSMRKVDVCQHTFGESVEIQFRLGAHQLGRPELARDFSAQARWVDKESRSLVQTATALGIIAKQLGVPVEMLWGRLDNWTDQDTELAKAIRESASSDALLMAQLGLNPDGSSQTPAKKTAAPKPAINVQ